MYPMTALQTFYLLKTVKLENIIFFYCLYHKIALKAIAFIKYLLYSCICVNDVKQTIIKKL